MILDIMCIIAGSGAWMTTMALILKCVKIRDQRIRDIQYATNLDDPTQADYVEELTRRLKEKNIRLQQLESRLYGIRSPS